MTKLLRTLKANYVYIITIFIIVILFLKCKYPSTKAENNSLRGTRTVELIKEQRIQCYLFILIMTSPKGKIRRQAIRETWLKKKEYSNMIIEYRFMIAVKDLPDITLKEIREEERGFSDLHLLVDHKDSYQSLTMKLLKSFVWIRNSVNANFVMKVDDDSFVRLDQMLPSLQKRQSLGRIYWGFFRGNSNVKRTGPWKEGKWFLSDHYLPYALGGGYIFSFDLLEYIWRNADWFTLYNSEDVSLGVWLASIRINRIHDVRFDTEYKSKGCSNKHIVSHKQQPEDMYSKYNQLLHNNRLCKKESESILTYDYDWNVSPIRCCKRVSISTLKLRI